MEIKKAIIPVAGLGTRFLPLSKVMPKELFPLVDKPLVQYTLEEAKAAGIKKIIFVLSPERKEILKYFKKSSRLRKLLQKIGKNYLLNELKILDEICETLSFSYVFQKKPLGDGQAVLLAERLIGKEPCFVLYPDDIVESKISCLKELTKIFKNFHQPVMALYRLPKENLLRYGVVKAKRITNRIFKIEKMIEKPSIKEISSLSNLAIVGKRIITPEVFNYLRKAKINLRGEIGLTDVLAEMLKDGKEVYGYEIKGRWLECGNKLAYLKSNFYLSLKNGRFGKDLKNFLKKEKLL